jgi:lysozyme family protein
LQRCIGAKVDGRVGPETIRHAHMIAERALIRDYLTERLLFMQSLKNYDYNRRGWTRRVIDFAIESVA